MAEQRCSYSELISFQGDLMEMLDLHGARLQEDKSGFTIGEEGFEQDFSWEQLKEMVLLHFEMKGG